MQNDEDEKVEHYEPLTFPESAFVRQRAKDAGDRSCPCLYTTPCSPRCTCVSPHSSRGCLRCCTYGSVEQRTSRARWLAKAIDCYRLHQDEDPREDE